MKWRTDKPKNGQRCVIIIEFENCNKENVFIMDYHEESDSFYKGNKDSIFAVYSFNDVKCWIEYPGDEL